MKIKKSDLKVVLYLVGVLALAAGYFLGYQKLAEKKTELVAQRTLLQQQEQQVNEIYENQGNYQEQADAATAGIDEILANYPSGVKAEDVILYAVDLENDYDAEISGMSFSEDNLLYSVGSNAASTETAAASDDEDGTDETTDTADTAETATATSGQDIGIVDASTVQFPQISLMDTTVTYNFKSDYTDCKTMFASILAFAEKRNVSSISLSYDSEGGQLVGNMNVNMYYISGSDKEYVEPDSGVTLYGTDNIFATLEKGDKNDEKNEDEEEDESEQ
jgi:hypothetical protein